MNAGTTTRTTPIAVGVEQAAAMLGISPVEVRRYVDAGLLPVVKLPSMKRPNEPSRRVLLAVDDLRAFVGRHRVGGTP